MRDIQEIFTTLGEQLREFGNSEESRAIIASAIEANPWFTEDSILRAVEAIRLDMLDRQKLEGWLSHYPAPTTSQRVAIIMAGNIPLVGFFDLLCVLCSGHRAYIKPSSKDRVLTQYIIDSLRDIETNIAIYDYSATEHYDMVIATGSDEANRYFESQFAGCRRLLRGSRHSVAVLDGKESNEELRGLYDDITAYFGLGCRSVSMLFVPEGHTLAIPHNGERLYPKYGRCVAATRALYRMQSRLVGDFGAFLSIEGKEFATNLATVVTQRYSDIEEVKAWLKEHSEQIQCVVSHLDIEECVPFGQAQHPQLWDYADGVDTMAFLREG